MSAQSHPGPTQHQDVGALSVAHHGVRLPGGGLSVRHDGSIEAKQDAVHRFAAGALEAILERNKAG